MAAPLKISIITAAYNIEDYVKATLTSVLGQGYPALEYIFIDGASSDATLDIARRHAGIAKLVSEPDNGQYHAIQKGAALATGEVMGWINADDILLPGALSTVADIFATFPEINWITGLPGFLNEAGQITTTQRNLPSYPRRYLQNGWYSAHLGAYLQQESMFWRRSLWDSVGGLDTRYSLAADFDLWTRFAQETALVPVHTSLAAFRRRQGQRSSAQAQYEAEVAKICANKPAPPRLWRWMAAQGKTPRALCRLLIHHQGEAISYLPALGWVKTRARRPISRLSFGDLLEERRKERLVKHA
ncbi:MAG: glycosyltransferase [Rhodobacteraceae bacterium]|nr:glycosyltransferase [Paracoccaceae bacterium]